MDDEICYDMPTVMWLLDPVFSVLMGADNSTSTEAEKKAGISEEEIRSIITEVFEIPDEVASNPVYARRVHLALQYLLAAEFAAPGEKPGCWRMADIELDEDGFMVAAFDINEISRKYHARERAKTGIILPFRR